MKTILLCISISLASGLLLINVYNSLVDAKSWGNDIPNSITAAREYYKNVNPGNFYRIFSPMNQVLALLVFILFWKSSPATRFNLGIVLVVYVMADALTFAYFYPRNEIMFKTAITNIDVVKKAWSEWTAMNWVRSFILLTGIFFSFLSLHKIWLQK